MGPRPIKSQVSIMAPGGEKKTQMNPFSQVSSTVLWILLASLATVCLVVLMIVSYLYAALVNKPPHPLEESMKKLGITIAVGLRSPKVKHENPLKVAEEAVRLPDHIKDSGKTFNDQKMKYQSLFRKSQKSGTAWLPFGNGLYYVSRGEKTWYEAENFCMSREAHLTSVLSSEEQNYVTSQLTQPAWIGLTDGGQGKWEWTDGSRLAAQRLWRNFKDMGNLPVLHPKKFFHVKDNENLRGSQRETTVSPEMGLQRDSVSSPERFWSEGQPGRSEHLEHGVQVCTIIVPSSKGQNWNDVDCNQLNRWVCKGTLDAEEYKIHQTH